MTFEFAGEVWYWRGPAPFHFVTVPEEHCAAIKAMASYVTYGWGMIPATVRIGGTEWRTALWPKGGHYVVPLKAKVRQAESVTEGDVIAVVLEVG